MWVCEQEVEERQAVEVVEARCLDEAHDDFVISDAVVGTVAESDFAHNDVAAQQPLSPVVVCTDFFELQACNQLVHVLLEFSEESVGFGMVEPPVEFSP